MALGSGASLDELDARMADQGYHRVAAATAEPSMPLNAGFPVASPGPTTNAETTDPAERETPVVSPPALPIAERPPAARRPPPLPPRATAPAEPSVPPLLALPSPAPPPVEPSPPPPVATPSAELPRPPPPAPIAMPTEPVLTTHRASTPETVAHEGSLARWLPVLALAGAAFATATILRSTFKHDDFIHLFELLDFPFGTYLTKPHGGHVMPVHKAAYAALYSVFGLSWAPYMALQYATHLVNVGLVYLIVRNVTGRRAPGAVAALLWGSAPVHVGTLNWFATFGQVLATTAFLLVTLDLERWSRRRVVPPVLSILGWYLLASVAVGSSASGVAFAVALLGLAFVLLDARSGRQRTVKLLIPLAALPIVHQQMQRSSAASGNYFRPDHFLALLGELASYGSGTILAGPLATVTERESFPFDLGRGLGVAIGVLALLSILALVIWAQDRSATLERRWYWAALLVGGIVYGFIAFGRMPNLDPVSEMTRTATRFHHHYTATIPIAIVLGLATTELPRLQRMLSTWPGMGILAVIAVANALAGFGTDGAWGPNLRKQVAKIDTTLEEQTREVAPGDTVYVHNGDFAPVADLMGSGIEPDRFPYLAGWYVIAQKEGVTEGRKVRFVEPDVEYVARVRERGAKKTRDLLVTPAEAEQAGARVVGTPRVLKEKPKEPAVESDAKAGKGPGGRKKRGRGEQR
jgi:hypothetical protein